MRKISYAIAGAVVVAAAGLTVAPPAHSAPPEPGDRIAVATKDRVPPGPTAATEEADQADTAASGDLHLASGG